MWLYFISCYNKKRLSQNENLLYISFYDNLLLTFLCLKILSFSIQKGVVTPNKFKMTTPFTNYTELAKTAATAATAKTTAATAE